MFTDKAGAYPSEAPFRCPLKGKHLDLPTNIRLGCGWEKIARNKHSSLLWKSVAYDCKMFIILAVGEVPLLEKKINEN